ncbi:hypothetical protein MBANPS3_006720 [Mucor bainieri]
MSSPWITLPQELVKKVFSKVDDKQDILELQHICLAWRPSALEKLYASITIPGDGGDKEQHLVQTLKNPSSETIHYVKKITVSPVNHDKAICNLCPNITGIDILTPTRQFYQHLCQLRQAQRLQKLQSVSRPWKDGVDDYGKLMLLIKNSATEISICSSTNAAISESNPITEAFTLAKHLKDFVCLEKIVVTTSVYLTLTQLGELLDMCPSTKIKVVEFTPQQIGIKHQSRLLSAASQIHAQPQRVLSSVKELILLQRTLPVDQDLQCIMKKFPALQKMVVQLGLSRFRDFSDSERSIQSADTAIAFVKYLWRIPYFDFQGFKTDPETMSRIISQTSKYDQVNRVCLTSTHRDELNLTTLGALRWKSSGEETTKSVDLRIPPDLESLYLHATQAFSPHVNSLHLQGSAIMGHERGTIDLPVNDRTKVESKTLVSSLEYAINNYPGLKTLVLCGAAFPPTYFDAAFKRRLRLDFLVVKECSMNAETWDILSKRLEHVTSFKIDLYNWNRNNPLEEDVYMPHTTLGDIFLFDYLFRFVKICTSTSTTYIDFKEEDSMDKPERLTEQQYSTIRLRSATPNEYCQTIICKGWSSVSNDYATIHNN